MKALCWHGTGDVRVDTVPDANIEQPIDVVIKISSTATCGSDLHLLDGYQPGMEKGDILGHEPMGVVIEVGSQVTKLKKGDRVVAPLTISCGSCFFCQKTLYSCCDTTNPNAKIAEKAMGHSPAGLFGFSHLVGGYAGGQAECVRVPHADVVPIKIESDLPDEKVLFLSDILPTGYMAAENAGIEKGDTVAVWGCGPVAQFTIKSAWMLGARRVIAIDRVPERLKMAEQHGKAETINFDKVAVYEKLQEIMKGRGPDRCIDAVGCEAHAAGTIDSGLDKAKVTVGLTTDRAHVLRYAIMCCRKAGLTFSGTPDPCWRRLNKGSLIRPSSSPTRSRWPTPRRRTRRSATRRTAASRSSSIACRLGTMRNFGVLVPGQHFPNRPPVPQIQVDAGEMG